MEIGYDKAVAAFARLDPEKRAPSLHPCYVASDAEHTSGLRPVFFVYEHGDSLFYHGFHLGQVAGTGFADIQSPYGYGGPVASTADGEFLAEAWVSFRQWCKENNVLAEFIRFHPLLENWCYYHGESFEDRQTVWIALQGHDLLSSYSVRARTAVRKAVKRACGSSG